ncbi:MAG: DoxX family protein [Oscillatoriophycideae cyanobacterium NC_groundwater_1537_Pr4_S-0.65um_50_18]|nr:DoxX family protein [Oscillatoriophycideae cyanobacterium NC_groundwater_1537_Pr4_S-0.65um_50_18]
MTKHSVRSSSLETQTEQHSSTTGLYATRNLLPLIARILLVAIFFWSGVNKILHPAETQAYMAAFGMPLTWFFLPAAIALELLGGLSVLLGIYPRLGAAALAFFTLITGFIFHSNFTDPLEQIMFMKNLTMVGGLLLVVQYGVGNTVWRSRQ